MVYRTVLVAIKDADTGRFFPAKLSLAVVVHIFALFGRVRGEGNLIVKIEVAMERGVPRERPAHTLTIGFQPLHWCAGDSDQRSVAMVQMHTDPVEIVRPEGATGATFVPIRPKHEVI